MTLEISEIGVRLTVGSAPAPATAKPANGATEGQAGARLSPQQFEDLVKACAQEVLDALRMIGER